MLRTVWWIHTDGSSSMIKGWSICGCNTGRPFHIVPEDDLKEHECEDCPCNPVVNEGGAVVHNSFDNREATEEVVN
jgi:hypothetical protein